MNNLEIKPVQENEIEQLVQLAKTTFVHTYAHLNNPENFEKYLEHHFNLAQMTAEFNDPDSAFFFAKQGEILYGYIKLNRGQAQTDQRLENAVEIERIYVKPEFKGQQIGRKLVEYALEFGRAKKLNWLWLGVWEKNPNAIGFYEKMGFKQYGTHDFIMGSERQCDFLMKQPVL